VTRSGPTHLAFTGGEPLLIGAFGMALKREGRFFVPWQPVITSGRRFRKTSAGQLFIGAVRLLFSPVKFFTHRQPVEKIWYDSNRTDDDRSCG